MTAVYVLRTPENVPFELELAGLSARGAAFAVDVAIMGLFAVAVMVSLSMLDLVTVGFAKTLGPLVFFVATWGYGIGFEWKMNGQTLGKKLLGLRVMGLDGFAITFTQAVVRNMVKVIDQLPGLYLLGGVLIAFHARGQRLGDLAANTVVVRERRGVMPERIVQSAERHNTFLGDPTVAHAVRRISPPERDAMLMLALRRETLPLAARHELFGALAAHLAARTRVDKPSFFSDEKFVLHLTAVLFAASDASASTSMRTGIGR